MKVSPAPHGDPEFIAKEAHSEYTEFYRHNLLYLLKKINNGKLYVGKNAGKFLLSIFFI